MKTITLNNGQTTELGTVICGTMRNEDVIPALMKTAIALGLDVSDQQVSCTNAATFDPDEDYEDTLNEVAEELFDLLSSLCPDGYYFGAHVGDGSDYGFWQDETQVTQDKDGNTIVNPDDREWHNKLYLVVFNPYAPHGCHYAAWADNESDALDYVVDYCEENNFVGYFLEACDIDTSEINIIFAGNHGLALDGDNLQIMRTKLA